MVKKLLYLDETRQATWLELFFDLIFVVALGKVTHLLAHVHNGYLSEGVWWEFVLYFIPLWWIWVGHMVYSNRFDSDSRPHRVTTLFLMFLLILLSVVISNEIISNYIIFIIIYCIARLFVAGMYFFACKKYPDKSGFALRFGVSFTIGALISLSAVCFSFSLYVVLIIFFGGILFDIFSTIIFREHAKLLPVDRDHLVERVGLLAIILLGESIISMSSGMTNVCWDSLNIITACFGFCFVCMIWWIYFDSFIFLLRSKYDVNGTVILYSQLFTYMSLAVLANTIRHAILDDLNICEYRMMAIVGIILFFFGKQVMYIVNVPEYRYHNVRNTLTTLLISGLSLLMQAPQYILMGLTLAMIVYVGMNYQSQIKLYGKTEM